MEKERVSGPIDGLSKLQIDRLATFVTGGETEEAEPALAGDCCGGGGKTGGGRKSALVNRAPAAVRFGSERADRVGGLGFSKPPTTSPFKKLTSHPQRMKRQMRVKHLEISACAESVLRICHLSQALRSLSASISRCCSLHNGRGLAKRLLLLVV